ncbi:glycoside hydrolase superfamily [Mrakia frigida]|uniref:beta-glucosidase n=1 Tax=Mrakia frigida TaxID=29902 RepID=UPI003FCBFFB2
MVKNWTLEEKSAIVIGDSWSPPGLCIGNVNPIPSVGFPGLCLQDAPVGVRVADLVSAFPAGVTIASTFDRNLARLRGEALGAEFLGKGINIALGPGMNLARNAEGGRNWEGFGADPYLAGEVAYETIRGMQTLNKDGQGVQAVAKHYIANDEEHLRAESSSNLDDRTLHELHLHPFLKSVQAGVANVMTGYNLVNNSWAAQNSKLNNDILKGELGFQGTIMSDWAGARSGVASILGGLDMNMPGVIDWLHFDGTSYFGGNLTAAVNNGSVPLSRVTDMATRVLASWFLLGQDKNFPATNFNGWNLTDPATNSHVNVQGDHYKLIRQIAASGTVLLKNVNNALPLQKPKSLAIIGDDAFPDPNGLNFYQYRGGNNGTLAVGWGSGANDFPYLVGPFSAIVSKVKPYGTSVKSSRDNYDLTLAASLAKGQEAALVFVNSDGGETVSVVEGVEGDRNDLLLWHGGDELILAVAAVNKKTIVVVHSVGPVDMAAWIDHPNVVAVVWANLPGQESGNSCTDVLFGDYNPSGRLPYTIAKNDEDYLHATPITDLVPNPQVNYDEKLNIDYRAYLTNNKTPRFAFGFGLSYTTFSYSSLKIKESKLSSAQTTELSNYLSRKSAVGSSLLPSLHATKWSVSIKVKNTGKRTGEDVPQLYLVYPADSGEPPRVLRGFEKVKLQSGHSTTVTFNLSTYDLSIWDVVKQKWTVPTGSFTVLIATDALASPSLEGKI